MKGTIPVHIFWRNLLIMGLGMTTVGCAWFDFHSDFDRDPLVMSHLTHNKADPSFSGTENAFSLEEDVAWGANSISRKPTTYEMTPPRGYEFETTARLRRERVLGHADDYSWIVGTLGYREGRRGGWYIHFASQLDDVRFGGKLFFANEDRLDILRFGDHVYVEGRLLLHGRGEYLYHVDSVKVLEP